MIIHEVKDESVFEIIVTLLGRGRKVELLSGVQIKRRLRGDWIVCTPEGERRPTVVPASAAGLALRFHRLITPHASQGARRENDREWTGVPLRLALPPASDDLEFAYAD